MTRAWGSRLAMLGLGLALLCVLAAMASGFGYRAGLWHFRTGFLILRVAAFAALTAGAICLLSLVLARGARASLIAAALGVLIALGFAYVPWQWKQTLDRLPYIHDITTDTDNPPLFVEAGKLRKEGDHPIAYDGPDVAAEQKKAYPDIVPLIVPQPRDKVFDAARKALADLGISPSGEDRAQGRIEGSDTSFWYGFVDDVAIRITEAAQGTRVDVRSKSRVGRSDLGQNAKRVRAILAKLKASLR